MTIGEFVTMLAYAVGGGVFYLAARQERAATEKMGTLALVGLAGGVIGAKVTEWLVSGGRLLAANPAAALDPRLGGRTLIGGVVVGWICVEVAKRRLDIRRSTGDLFALALPAGEAVGRIGCFFNGCCFGIAADVPWAVYQHGALRHPAQLYAALVAVAIFAALASLRDRMKRPGELFRVYLILFGLSRFGLEFLRERSAAAGGLSLAQWVCLQLALAGGVLLLARRRAGLSGAAGS